jgi:Ca-activated chloride channel family protein
MRSLVSIVSLLLALPAAANVSVSAKMANPVVLAGQSNRAFVKVAVAADRAPETAGRTAVNVALVLDKSGSMGGQKIKEARRAAILAVQRLLPDDIVSVITYDSVVRVIVPATKARDKQAIIRAISRVGASGSTALFAGVSKGAAELRKFIDRERVNRIVLLSDGLANIGPSSPGELASLGASLAKEGIAVTTIGLGLGYNEDLMASLAAASDGNHAFAESAADLVRIFNLEFGDLFAVTAQDVRLTIDCAAGVRPIRVLGRNALIDGRKITTRLGHLNGTQEKYLMIEVEVPSLTHGTSRSVADVRADYRTRQGNSESSASAVGTSADANASVVAASANRMVMVSVTEMLANEQNKIAMRLRDEGRVREAQKVLRRNAKFLKKRSQGLASPKLQRMKEDLEEDEAVMNSGDWNKARKSMRKRSYGVQSQQAY